MNEWMKEETITHFFKKYNYLFFISQKVKIGFKCEKDRNKRLRMTEDSYDWLHFFLTPFWIYIQGLT